MGHRLRATRAEVPSSRHSWIGNGVPGAPGQRRPIAVGPRLGAAIGHLEMEGRLADDEEVGDADRLIRLAIAEIDARDR